MARAPGQDRYSNSRIAGLATNRRQEFMSSSVPPAGRGVGHHAFPSTHWSIVLKAGAGAEPEARSSLEILCRQYWYPIYSFIRRQGRTHHEAEDLAQAFFAQLLSNEGLARARTFLLTALRNFMIDEWHHERAAKRGGGVVPLPLEFDAAEATFSREPPDNGITPEQAFDRSWALGVIEHALADLRIEYEASGRGRLFEALSPVVWGGGAPEPLAIQAQRLGMQEGALKVAIHRLRKRLREQLQENIAATIADPGEIEDELRHLVTSLSEKPSSL
jgi:DNA-directed RNA polymerase specialized sigma24 family protein